MRSFEVSRRRRRDLALAMCIQMGLCLRYLVFVVAIAGAAAPARAQLSTRDSAEALLLSGAKAFDALCLDPSFCRVLPGGEDLLPVFAQLGRAAELYRISGDLHGQASAHAILGDFYESLAFMSEASTSDNRVLWDSAASHLLRAFHLLEQYGDRSGQLEILDDLRVVEGRSLPQDTALFLARRALRLERERGSIGPDVARRVARVGELYLWSGNPDSAAELYRGAIAEFEPRQVPHLLLEGMGDAFVALEATDSAIAAYEEARVAARRETAARREAGEYEGYAEPLLTRKLLSTLYSDRRYRSIVDEYEVIVRAAEEALQSCPDCAGFQDEHVLELVASAYEQLGKPDSAVIVAAVRAYQRRALTLQTQAAAAALLDEIRATVARLFDLLEERSAATEIEAERHALFETGKLYLEEFQHQALGVQYLEAALDLQPTSGSARAVDEEVAILHTLADALDAAWQPDSATAYRRRAIDRLRGAGRNVHPSQLRALAAAYVPDFGQPFFAESGDSLRLTLQTALRAAERLTGGEQLADSIRLDLLRLDFGEAVTSASRDSSGGIVHLARAARIADQLIVADGDVPVPMAFARARESALARGRSYTEGDTLERVEGDERARVEEGRESAAVSDVAGRPALGTLLSRADSTALLSIYDQILQRLNAQQLALLTGHTDQASARSMLRSLMSAADALGPMYRPVLLGSVGVVYARVGEADSALHYARSAVTLAREQPGRPFEGLTLLSLAVVHSTLQQPDSALATLERAQSETPASFVPLIDALLFQMSTSAYLELGLPERALTQARRSLPTRLDDNQLFSSEGAGGLYTLGEAYLHVDRPTLALALLRPAAQSIELLTVDGGEDAQILSSMGRAHALLGNLDSAAHYLHRGLAAAERGPSGMQSFLLWPLAGLARLHLDGGRPDSALIYAERAAAVAGLMGDQLQRARALLTLALSYQKIGTETALGRAVAYHDTAFGVLTTLRTRVGSDENRLGFAAQFSTHIGAWSLAWLARGTDPSVGNRRAALAALAVTENGRAQALLDLVSSSGTRGTVAAIPATSTRGADLAQVGDSLAASAVPANGALLSYLVTRDTLVVWMFRADREVVVVRTAVADSTLAALGGTLRRALDRADGRGVALVERQRTPLPETHSPDIARDAARALSDLLLPARIRALLPDSGEVLIIPHGVVGIVPFAMLPIDRRGSAFGERHALRYAPSLRMAQTVTPSNVGAAEIAASGPVLILGDPPMPSAQVDSEWVLLGNLPYASEEADSVAERFHQAALPSAEATETRVRRLMPEARIIHLATHGFAYSSDRLSDRSFVALGPDHQNDGLLTVSEIMSDPDLSLLADLVVLSACQTGLGLLREAEGSLGLQRAFLARGAKSVLVSLWNVDDRATAVLMRSFYSHWLSGASKSEALRKAQNQLRAVEGFDHPQYWAAFQIVGAN